MSNLVRHHSFEEFVRAKDRAHHLRAQAIDHVLNDVVAGAVRRIAAALKRGTLSLLLPSETRHW